MRDNRERFLSLNGDAVKRQLKLRGVRGSKQQGENMSDVDRVLAECTHEYSCEYAGPLAGHTAGVIEFKGSRVLVTDDPVVVKGEPRPFPMIEKFSPNYSTRLTRPKCSTFLAGSTWRG